MKILFEALAKIGITKQTAKRAARTFIQAAIGSIVANAAVLDFSEGKEILKGAICTLLVSAIAAGIAAVMNLEKPETEAE